MVLGAFGALGVDVVLGFAAVELELELESDDLEPESDFGLLGVDDFSAARESVR